MKKRMIETKLQQLSGPGTLRFHMPGHKGRSVNGVKDWTALDYTEVPGADNLHAPETIILEAQQKLASIYGSGESSILVGGTTAGIQCAIMGACGEGESLLVPVNCHRSVYAGLALGRINGVYFEPEYDSEMGFGKSIDPERVEELIKMHPEVRGLIMVNPTYYGTTSDLEKIAEILHRSDKILMVDEAHGAHLRFCEGLPVDGVTAGADVVIQSTHKLLGSFTQSALLHMQGDRIDRRRVKKFLSLLQSSSPSYPLMMSVENAVDQAAEVGGRIFGEIAGKWDRRVAENNPRDCITLYSPKDSGSYDKSKWLFWVKNDRGVAVEKQLLGEFNIQCELSAKNHVLAMTGIGTEMADLDRLIAAIGELNRRYGQCPGSKVLSAPGGFTYLEKYPLWQALYNMEAETILLEEAVGKAAADFIIPYPPGIPALLPGSLITEETITRLTALRENGEVVMGLGENGEVAVVRE
ncbi:MAG: aminotransferase class V-fold PLP-dependent enzyme [Eubacterium sp.]